MQHMAVHGFIINPKSGTARLAQGICQALSLHGGQHHKFKRDYLDSFDWRLLNKGYCLQAEHHEEATLLQLFRLRDWQLVTQLQTSRTPRFPFELGRSRLATLLMPILDVRALLPQIATEVRQQRLQQLDAQDKLTGELIIEEIKPTSSRQALKLLLHIPIRGYDKDNRAIARQLKQEEALQAIDEPPLPLLAKRLGVAHDYDSKPAITLDGAGRSDVQVKQLLAFFLDVMRRNEAGVIHDIDSEFVHDYRIAVRRSRTLLAQVPGLMPQRTQERFGAHLANLGRITTPLRDLDVMLLNLDDYRNLLPTNMRADLDPALVFVRRQRRDAWLTVSRHLKTKSYASFCQRWRDFLEAPVPDNTRLPNAKRPLKDVADERIWKNYSKVLKQGRAITKESPPEEVHALRKRCKKLRYLLEFFRSLYPKRKLKELINILKQLQDNLGEYQDIHVHIDFFQQLRKTMQKQGRLPKGTGRALDEISAALDIQQQKCRREFHGRFREFSGKSHQQLFKQLFKP
jgi:CHAD domain-containing protein